MKTMTQEEMVTAANKWAALEAIRETYGLDRELEEIAYLLLARGKKDDEVLRVVYYIRDQAGQVTECERRVREAELRLRREQEMLDKAHDGEPDAVSLLRGHRYY